MNEITSISPQGIDLPQLSLVSGLHHFTAFARAGKHKLVNNFEGQCFFPVADLRCATTIKAKTTRFFSTVGPAHYPPKNTVKV